MASADLTGADLDQLRRLFDAAWAEEGFEETDWAHTFGGDHAVWKEGGRILAHASVVPRELRAGGARLRTGYVEAVATWPAAQGRGLGTAVMRAANDLVRADFELGALATEHLGFYARLGWETWRGPLSVRTADGEVRTPEEDGYVMVLWTPTSPTLSTDLPLSCDPRPGDVW
ncbi:MAG TPA: GNAT family N-acetyltransferase [Actinomycetota bacterium]